MKKLLVLAVIGVAGAAVAAKRRRAAQEEAALWAEATGTKPPAPATV